MTCNSVLPERVQFTPGAKFEFWLDFVDEVSGQPISIDTLTDPKVVFCNCAGERVEVALDTNNDAGRCGSVFISVPAADSAKLDQKSLSFDFEGMDGTELVIYPVNNKLEILERNCPPTA